MFDFPNRIEAGRELALKLQHYKDNPAAIVLALPRGGVVTGYEVANALNLPLDLIVTRKIPAPENPEFAIGATDETGQTILDQATVLSYGIPDSYIKATVEEQKKEAQRRLNVYRGDRPPLDLKNKTAILVDDGIATGATMRAAVLSAKTKHAEKVIVAVPVTSREALRTLKNECDDVIYIKAPLFFGAVGSFYKHFPQNEDQEVIDLMKKATTLPQ